jgi:hypothetical protein
MMVELIHADWISLCAWENEAVMLPEYDFDYRKARPNRFALLGEGGHLMVVLDPDVAQVFTTSAAVNAVLRALITTMPKA